MFRTIVPIVLLVAGCSPSPATLAALEARKNAEDDMVIALVLDDFVTRTPEFSGKQPEQDSILLNLNTRGESGFLSSDQLLSDVRDAGWSLSAELLADINARNKKVVSLKSRKLGNGIIYDDFTHFPQKEQYGLWEAMRRKHPTAKVCVTMWMPGYNKAVSQAIVRLSFSPSPHGAMAIYLLVKKDGRWTIRAQEVGYYV